MRKTKEEIARAAIAGAAENWKDSPEAFKSVVDGELIFTFYAHSESGTSSLALNPLPAVLEIIEEIDTELKIFDDERVRDDVLLLHVTDATGWPLSITRQHFEDSLTALPLLATTAKSAYFCAAFGAKKERQELIEKTVKIIADKIRRRFGVDPQIRRGKKADYVVGDSHIYHVVYIALRETGKTPSEIYAAREIFRIHPDRWNNVTGAKSALRKWLKDRNLSWGDAVALIKKEIDSRQN